MRGFEALVRSFRNQGLDVNVEWMCLFPPQLSFASRLNYLDEANSNQPKCGTTLFARAAF